MFPGIRELLGHAPPPACRCSLATSKPRALAEPLLDALGLRRRFRAVVGPELDSEDEQKAVTVGRALRALARPSRPL